MACDIKFKSAPVATDETAPGANNGTISAFAYASTDSAFFINYEITGDNGFYLKQEDSGQFTGLTPQRYKVTAFTDSSCTVSAYVTIKAATSNTTNIKYRLQFTGYDNITQYTVNIRDVKHQYNKGAYPKYVSMSESPVKWRQALESDDKRSPLVTSKLTLSLLTDGTFSTDEFVNADERTWLIEYMVNDRLRFQGWLLPDQCADQYDDDGYDFPLIATDGILSLKSAPLTADGELPLLGIKSWFELLVRCLNALDYNYESIIIVKSLQFDGQMDWTNLGIWGDAFYDDNLEPQDIYSMLTETLVTGFGLCLMQHGNKFALVDYNVLSHLAVPYNNQFYPLAFYEYDKEGILLATGNGVEQPAQLEIGWDGDLQPVEDTPDIGFDLSYKTIKGKIDYSTLATMYPNGNFEINPVEGQLPYDVFAGPVNGGPAGMGLTSEDAYLGQFSLKATTPGRGVANRWVERRPGMPVDQAGKKITLSFNWKPHFFSNDIQLTPAVSVILNTPGGRSFFLQQSPYRAYDASQGQRDNYDQSTGTAWVEIGSGDEYYSEGQVNSIKVPVTTDYEGWSSFSITSPATPSAGSVVVRYYGVQGLAMPGSDIPLVSGNDRYYLSLNPTADTYALIDNLVLTQSDAEEGYVRKTGETQSVRNNTNYAKAEDKEIDLPLFNYPYNKRLVGNVFWGLDYTTGVIDNIKWTDPFQTQNFPDSLQYVLTQQFARTYQRPMMKWEGTVQGPMFSFYSLFQIAYYEGKSFMPLSIEHDALTGESHVELVETDDTPADTTYKFLLKFEKSAKRNS